MPNHHEPEPDTGHQAISNTDTSSTPGTLGGYPPLPAVSWIDQPVQVSFTGEPLDDGLPFGNTITVGVVDHATNPGFDTSSTEAAAEREWAADTDTRPLVRLDANYKSTRPGPFPVDLTRTAAVGLVAALLAAVEDTFHLSRVGSLRATEALALLDDLAAVDEALLDLRAHAVTDLAQAPDRAAAARALHMPTTPHATIPPVSEPSTGDAEGDAGPTTGGAR